MLTYANLVLGIQHFYPQTFGANPKSPVDCKSLSSTSIGGVDMLIWSFQFICFVIPSRHITKDADFSPTDLKIPSSSTFYYRSSNVLQTNQQYLEISLCEGTTWFLKTPKKITPNCCKHSKLILGDSERQPKF